MFPVKENKKTPNDALASRTSVFKSKLLQQRHSQIKSPNPSATAPIITGSPLSPAASSLAAGLLGFEEDDEVVLAGTLVGAETEERVVMLVTFMTALAVGAAVRGLLVGNWLTRERDVEAPLLVLDGALTAAAPPPLALLIKVPPAILML